MERRVLLLTVGTFATGTNALIVAGVLPEIARGFAVTPAEAGLSVTVAALAYAISAPVLPVVFQRVPPRRILVVALVGFTLGNVAMAFIPTFAGFLVMRAVVGVLAAAVTPHATAAAVALSRPQHRGRAITTVMLGLTLANVFGVPIGIVIGAFAGYRGTFLFVALLGLLGALALAGVPRVPAAPPLALPQLLRMMVMPRPVALIAVTCAAVAGTSTVSVYFAPLLAETAGVDSTQLAAVFLVIGLVGVATVVFGGRMIDRFGGRALAVVGTASLCVVTPLLAVPVGIAGLLLILAVWAAAGSLVGATQPVELAVFSPHKPAPLFALNTASMFVGTGLGSALGSLALANGQSVRDLPVLAVAPLAVATVISISLLLRRPRPLAATI